MTQDDIIRMAHKAGFRVDPEGEILEGDDWHIQTDAVERFAQLVAEHEREACAVIAEEYFCGCGRGECSGGDLRAQDIAKSIRARGQQ